jgi:hypothetical protein
MKNSPAIQAFLKETVAELGGAHLATVDKVIENAEKKRPELDLNQANPLGFGGDISGKNRNPSAFPVLD